MNLNGKTYQPRPEDLGTLAYGNPCVIAPDEQPYTKGYQFKSPTQIQSFQSKLLCLTIKYKCKVKG